MRRDLRTASPKTSTAFAPATRPRCFSKMCLCLPTDLVGGVEGQGLAQAQAVFGYTRLMVGAFGLGAGWEALRRAIRYSQMRVQAGAPLSQKQGYTHKLIVPNAARLEAARSYIEWVAERIDSGEPDLATEGAVAKYLATEAGNKAAEDAIQALGGYGYTKEYMVEKIKRDVRITTIYEGTSEIMEWTIARDRWQLHLKTRGAYYNDWAATTGSNAQRRTDNGAQCRCAGLARAGRDPGTLPARSPDAQPARPVPPGRTDRLCRNGGDLCRARFVKSRPTRSRWMWQRGRRWRASTRVTRRSRSPPTGCAGRSGRGRPTRIWPTRSTCPAFMRRRPA